MASSTRRILFTLSGLVTIGVAIALLYSSFVPGTDHLDSFGLPHASPYVDANQDMLVAPPLQVVRSTNPSRFAASISIALQGGGSGDSQENEYLSSRVVIRGRSSAVCTTLRMLKGAWCGELDSDEYSVVGVDTTTSVPVLVSAPLITPGAPDATILLAVRNEWSLYVRDTATRSDLSGVWLAALDPTESGARFARSATSSSFGDMFLDVCASTMVPSSSSHPHWPTLLRRLPVPPGFPPSSLVWGHPTPSLPLASAPVVPRPWPTWGRAPFRA